MVKGQIASDPLQGFKWPQAMKTVNGLKNYLCSRALQLDENSKNTDVAKVNPDACRRCEVQCGYGKRLIEIVGG